MSCWWQDQQSVPPPPVGVRGIMKSPWRNPEHYIGAVAGTQWWIDARDRLKWTNLQAHFVERNDRGLQASKAPWATSLQTRERGSKHSRSSRNQQTRATALSNQQMNPSQQPGLKGNQNTAAPTSDPDPHGEAPVLESKHAPASRTPEIGCYSGASSP